MVHSLLIGGTKGLGRAVARQLALRGDKVSVIGRQPIAISDLEAGDIQSFTADVTNQQEISLVLEHVTASRGPLNYCIFLQRYRGKEDPWEGEFHTTLTATRNIVDYLVPHFSPIGDKALVMVSSVFAKHVGAGQAASYHVMKAGLDQLMRYYAVNLGAKNIRSNGITPFTFLKEESKNFYLENKELISLYNQIIPLKRLGTTEDLAYAIDFLCSPRAGFLTGQNLTIDGGLSLVWPETLARELKKI